MGARPIGVVFFGDSICFGQGVPPHQGWVTRISACLEQITQSSGEDILVTNASVNGDTTRLALERIAYDVQSHPLNIILVQFGMNDCNIWDTDKGCPRVSPRAFAANLMEIIDRALTFGASRIFLNTNHPSGRSINKLPNSEVTYQEQNERYNDIIRSVAQERHRDVTLIDVESAFKDHIRQNSTSIGKLILPDLLHLSRAGHDLYYSIVAPTIEGAVREHLKLGYAV